MVPGLPSSEGLAATGAFAAFFVTLGILIRQLVPWRKARLDADAALRTDLLHRVESLERKLERERIRHNAERALDRHRLNNITQCFDAMLLLIKANPERAGEVVVMIEEMRAKQIIAEAEEKAIIRAAEIADERAVETDHDGN